MQGPDVKGKLAMRAAVAEVRAERELEDRDTILADYRWFIDNANCDDNVAARLCVALELRRGAQRKGN